MATPPVFLPGEFHGQGSLVGYSPWGCKELNTTEQITHTDLIYDRFFLFPLYQVHERSVQSDFLLIILKEILQKRSDLHLILMSATVDCEKFSTYFTHCPILRISGRSYPVEVSFFNNAYVNRNYMPTSECPQKIGP